MASYACQLASLHVALDVGLLIFSQSGKGGLMQVLNVGGIHQFNGVGDILDGFPLDGHCILHPLLLDTTVKVTQTMFIVLEGSRLLVE